ncbi:MAG: endonuclease III [Ferruginibacter sp.]|nr:endonuclease III [Cytophagales bacterium]
MRKQERFRHFVAYFVRHYPEPQTELHYSSPYELLIAVILSAQCTDKRINLITPALFARFPTPESLAISNVEELSPYLRTVSYPNNKTKHLLGMARMLVNDFQSEVPASAEELQKLPGVGRKTAHVIVSVVYNQPAMAVDTHVFRVSRRLGLATQSAKTPLEVEKQLIAHLPTQWVSRAHHWLILHGRYVCVARSPKCSVCPLTGFCRYYEKNANPAPGGGSE